MSPPDLDFALEFLGTLETRVSKIGGFWWNVSYYVLPCHMERPRVKTNIIKLSKCSFLLSTVDSLPSFFLLPAFAVGVLKNIFSEFMFVTGEKANPLQATLPLH